MFTTYKEFCFQRPFSNSVDLIFPFFPKFLEIYFYNLYLALATCFAVGYAAFATHDRAPAVYQTLLP